MQQWWELSLVSFAVVNAKNFIPELQAAHNPRAEAARSAGCSHERFLELMRQDDAFDAPLTELGENQAREGAERYRHALQGVDLVVSSPLSRALRTADLTLPPPPHPSVDGNGDCDGSGGDGDEKDGHPRRVCVEDFREINGWLINAKRRDRSDLEDKFRPPWDFAGLTTETDEAWTETLETESSAAERGYRGMLWLSEREEERILVVCHGGILRFMMNQHPHIKLEDERTCGGADERGVGGRFGNCELREFVVRWTPGDGDAATVSRNAAGQRMEIDGSKRHVHSMASESLKRPVELLELGPRPVVMLTEVSLKSPPV